MATGRLGVADLAAATNTSVYTVPADTFSVVTVSLCNRSAGTRSVRVAVAAAGTPLNAEYIEYDADILANGVLERTGIVMDASKILVVRADSTDVSAVVYGIETATV
tara:strand:- start:60 stop:380 length:321 start_codon:yes stop_codon:yes gene_type:complete